MLSGSERPPQSGTDEECSVVFYFYPEDVRALRERIIAAGYEVGQIERTFYNMLEFRMRDPDGGRL